MLKSEFVQRTGFIPSDQEYHYIEEAYYEFDGDKDAFCRRWKNAVREGWWAKELRFREEMDRQKVHYEELLAEKEELLEFYRGEHAKGMAAQRKIYAIKEALSKA